jgi:hypothetical protein
MNGIVHIKLPWDGSMFGNPKNSHVNICDFFNGENCILLDNDDKVLAKKKKTEIRSSF